MIHDPQVLDFITATEAAYPADANGASAADNRRYYDAMCAIFRVPRPKGLAVSDRRIADVPCRIYGKETPVFVLYLHGGGFIVGGLDSHDDVCAEIADATGLQVVAVDYRLAPEHRWPAQLDDARAVWRAMDRPGVVVGDSAGGMLAAALCLAERAPAPLGQVLIYPGLGGDGSAPSYLDNADAPLLRTRDLDVYRTALHGDDAASDPLAAPLSAALPHPVPPAFIVTADVDPLRDDGRDYAQRLSSAGFAVVLRNESQLPHGYLRARAMSNRARRSFQAILAQIAILARDSPVRPAIVGGVGRADAVRYPPSQPGWIMRDAGAETSV